MIIYVVHSSDRLLLATQNRGQAESLALALAGKYDRPQELEFRAGKYSGSREVYYIAGRTGRWNRSGYTITEMTEGVSHP